jgi:16S rRNA (uracil1498-N3)-methyltransferase
MGRRRFYVPRNSIQEGTACLPSDQSHHLRDVLRIGSGEIVEIFDGAGNGYIGEVDLTDSLVYVRKLQSIPIEEPQSHLILAAALIKSSKFEWILQKATELGIQEIIPLKTRFSEIEIPSGKVTLRLERWDRIIREASKQCRRSSTPRMHAPRAFADLVSDENLSSCSRFFLYEKASKPWRPEHEALSERVVICIGPEGGWDSGEIQRAGETGWQVCSLGPWVLRAETAAIAAVSIIQHQINLLNIKT